MPPAPQTHLEIEDTYDVGEDAELPVLDDWPGVVAVDTERFELEATYFDTADLKATRARITVRRRTGGADAGWHVKLPVHGTSGRHEIRLPLGRAVHTVPKQLRDLLRATLRDEAMTPVAVLRTDRTVHRLRAEDGRVLAEIADDRVSAGDSRRGTVSAWREWEVELVEGEPRLLKTARKRLAKAGAVPSASGSKLARTLAGQVPDPPETPAPSRKGPSGDVVRARLVEQYAEVVRRDPAVRRDEPDSVHQMRVAIRRLRTALATYRPFLDRAVTDPLREELKWLGDELGEARDAQVQRRYLSQRLDALSEDTPGFLAAWSAIGTGTDEWAAQAHARLTGALDSERYLHLLDRLQAVAEQPPLRDRADRPVTTAMNRRVRHEWSRAVSRLRAVDQVDGDDHDAALHETRKAFKRLRYAVEPLVPVYGKDAKRLVKRLKVVQTHLGDHHDAVAARAWLRSVAGEDWAQGGAGFALGVLHERLGRLRDRQEERFEEAWLAASRPGLRAFLAE